MQKVCAAGECKKMGGGTHMYGGCGINKIRATCDITGDYTKAKSGKFRFEK